MKRYSIIILISLLISAEGISQSKNPGSWEKRLDNLLPYLGHRNWIIIVDKAFPAQTSPGMEIINTDSDILDVSKLVLARLNASSHVKPVIYLDKEFEYLTTGQVPQIPAFRDKYKALFKEYPAQTMLHESVFGKLDEASRLFKIIVLKTNCLIPYSSVFIELDCKYWNDKAEQELRKSMSH